MENQVLSIDQCKELAALGLDMKDASMLWYPCMTLNKATNTSYVGYYFLTFNTINSNSFWETTEGKNTIPTYTIQDILEKLPKVIETEYDNFELGVDMFNIRIFYKDFKHNKLLNQIFGDSIQEAAFNMLKWCIENKYIMK